MSLLSTIKNPKLRKIFGKKELKIIEKQLLGINLTQSEKNRLSRDIREKLDIIEELSKYQDEFELKKGAKTKQIINDTLQVILKHKQKNNIKKIVLFGSFVENKFAFNSDIDIAVEFNNITLKDATLFRKDIHADIDDKIDIQVFNHLPDKIKTEIKNKGKRLYEKQNTR